MTLLHFTTLFQRFLYKTVINRLKKGVCGVINMNMLPYRIGYYRFQNSARIVSELVRLTFVTSSRKTTKLSSPRRPRGAGRPLPPPPTIIFFGGCPSSTASFIAAELHAATQKRCQHPRKHAKIRNRAQYPAKIANR